MQLNVFMLAFNHVQHYMTSIVRHAFAVAKPLAAFLVPAAYHFLWVVDAAVGASMVRKSVEIVRLD